MNVWVIVIAIFEFLLGIIITLGMFILNNLIKRMDKTENDTNERIHGVEKDIKSIKDNYLDRFAIVIQNQNDVKEELLLHNTEVKQETWQRFGELKSDIAELSSLMKTQTELCRFIQKQKDSH